MDVQKHDRLGASRQVGRRVVSLDEQLKAIAGGSRLAASVERRGGANRATLKQRRDASRRDRLQTWSIENCRVVGVSSAKR